MTQPTHSTLTELEKSYQSAKLKLLDASQGLKKLERECMLKNNLECLQNYDKIQHGHHNMCKSRERTSSNCLKDCFAKIKYRGKLMTFEDISDPRDQLAFLECKKICLEDVISKINDETKMLRKSESDLKFKYLGNFV